MKACHCEIFEGAGFRKCFNNNRSSKKRIDNKTSANFVLIRQTICKTQDSGQL